MSKGQDVGYVRVSSVGQNTERQLDDIELDVTYEDKVSGKDTKRPQLKECMKHLRAGDTLHCHSIDRLARNLKDLENILEELVGRGIRVKFHKEGLVFSGDSNPMAVLMMQMIGAVSQFELAIIKERREEGVAIAMKKGTKFGRKVKLNDKQVKEIRSRVNDGEEKKALAGEYGVSRGTIYNALK